MNNSVCEMCNMPSMPEHKFCNNCGTKFSAIELAYIATDLKECFYCAELIRKEAIKCKYCNSLQFEQNDFSEKPSPSRASNSSKNLGIGLILGAVCVAIYGFLFSCPLINQLLYPIALVLGILGLVTAVK